jgi:glucan phosphoethanolaminetransferase (alkaline phosphatase superfamily)
MNLSAAIKGLITGIIMIGIALAVYYSGQPPGSSLQYFIYAVYAVGIVWAIVAWKNSAAFSPKFSEAFQTGFKCFVVVTLLMVLFTAIFTKMHPEFAEEAAKYMREELTKKNGLPTEIDESVNRFKNSYTTTLVYGSIFGYLIIGAAVTAVTSLLITRKKS